MYQTYEPKSRHLGEECKGKVMDSCVTTPLRAIYMNKKSALEDSVIAQYEKLGPIVSEEMKPRKKEIKTGIQVGICDLELYDDAPKDNDLDAIK
ncbi:hypothetical protein TNCT_521901 [Trichonephila clavata]|uniref:Uncharacterized protein n=1 Tax=Trichonephila clavata TaxID=2740835 RepID=A0A8X6LBN8_TRICU|nr:hypothetical protein TNCT_521901 [Trichonephila clavata]